MAKTYDEKRDEKLYYGRQWIDDDDISAVLDVLHGDLITCGPKVKELEHALERYTKANHAVVVSNGTAALHCACMAAGIGPGDEVITTPLTFAASSNCILYCGARPVFADIDPRTYLIDPNSIRKHITSKTKAVIAVDYAGQAVKIKEIRDICNENNLIFIEDAAHSIGTNYMNKPVGALADMTCFSFHPVKNITSGEGGAITTNDPWLYERLKQSHAHGIVHDEDLMEGAPHEGIWYYEQISLGYNYRMTDFQAALLLSQLNKLDKFKRRRQEIVRQYDEVFYKLSGINIQEESPESDTCRHLYVIRIDEEKLSCSRRQFFDALVSENIQPQVHYVPVYWFPFYQHMGYKKGICPIAEEVYKGIMSLPLYPKLSDDDVEYVISKVEKIVSTHRI